MVQKTLTNYDTYPSNKNFIFRMACEKLINISFHDRLRTHKKSM